MVTLDAKNQILGRLASKISTFLIGKHNASYLPNCVSGEEVCVENVDQMIISGKKWEEKIYYKHTTYPGHLKEKKMKEFAKPDLLRNAVWTMLPKNRLRQERIKLLRFKSTV